MVSGTPILTTRLEGIPQEYYQYMYVVNKFSVEDLKEKIENILNKDQTELDSLGEKARQFVLDKKNSKNQVGNLYSRLQEFFEDGEFCNR